MRKIATVIGGSSFVTDYIVERLVKQGFVVRIAVSQPIRRVTTKIFGNVGQIIPLYCSIEDEATFIRAVEGASIVINLLEAEAGKSKVKLEKINVTTARHIARLSAAAGVRKLLHFSALDADVESPSPYLASKKKGEEAVQQAFPEAIIVRSGIIFGPEDEFLNKLALMTNFLPIMPVYQVNTRLQPVYAGDVADAVVRIIECEQNEGATYHLAGPEVYTNRELTAWLVRWLHRNNEISGLFPSMIQLMAFTLQFMPGSLMTIKLLNLMKHDSILRKNENGLLKLGIVPTSMQEIAPLYLYCYRPADDREALRKLLDQAGI